MLQTLFIYIWTPLLLCGFFLLIFRPIVLFLRKKSPLSPRSRSLLWFLQALGFWSFLTGSWMILQTVIPSNFDEESPAQKNASEPTNEGNQNK